LPEDYHVLGVICDEHRCIFIHIPKNAGQSIETVFLRLVNLTWATRARLLLRANADPKLGPPRLAHLKAHEYVECGHLAQEKFRSYLKFAFVRNPWDRMVSIYKYMGLRKGLSFKEFLTGEFRNDIWKKQFWFVGPQIDFVCDQGGELVVNFLGRFESLQADFRTVCERLGLAVSKLPHVNKSKGQKLREALKPCELRRRLQMFCAAKNLKVCRCYEDYYDEESKEIVAELYAKDIIRFGYGFGRAAVRETERQFSLSGAAVAPAGTQ